MASNFAFLHEKFPELAELGILAERYLRSDPQSCLMKAGLLCEGMIRVMFALDDITLPALCDAVERIDILQRREVLPADVAAAFHLMRKIRNKAAHEGLKIPETKTLYFLQITHSLCGWFFQTYGDESYRQQNFVAPQDAEISGPSPARSGPDFFRKKSYLWPPESGPEPGFPQNAMPMNQHPEWSYGAVLYEMNVRQLTPEGTLRAATSKLPFLKDLGVDAVWLMPVYPIGEAGRKGSLGSYYSIRDYCAVNPELGTMADFDAFVAEAHRLGMRVLLDWVANHTARDARWIAEKPASWYERDAAGRPAVPWDWSDTAKLNYADRDVWRAQADAMEFWLTQHDVDGFRCDMAMLVPIEFWNETSLRLRRVKPDLFMLAEAEERNLFEEGAFDACYAWRMHHLMNDVARQRTRVTALRDYIYADRDDYPDSAMRLAFTSNHDENSWNGSEFSRLGDAREIMAVFTFVVPRGLPLIYTGQEIGYDHSFAFFDRDPIPRYEANAFTGFYRRLTALRHDNPALAAGERGGAMVEIRNNAEDCLMTFVRETGGNRVVAVMNLSPYAIHADYYTGIYAGMYTDAMTGEPFELRGRVEEDMAPWSYRILTR